MLLAEPGALPRFPQQREQGPVRLGVNSFAHAPEWGALRKLI
jgi:hypothetical protein